MDIMKFEAQRMLTCIVLLLILTDFASSHTVITYPGWRENVLKSSGTVEDTNGLGVGLSEKSNGTKELLYPYGQEWIYPCGGAPTSTNRTKWPIKGGAFAFQPGWFPGHKTAFIYVNIGLGTQPPNISQVLVPPFQLVGPTADPYPGTFCLMHIGVPETLGVKKGDNATLQLIETAGHGAALYNVSIFPGGGGMGEGRYEGAMLRTSLDSASTSRSLIRTRLKK
ncbi:hypothetical protein KEM55_004091 [Ascosphaera atra]|nr:hypothetical protein KEM55_004091 [Ascosphaera atra]